jgi:hypothetical protein
MRTLAPFAGNAGAVPHRRAEVPAGGTKLGCMPSMQGWSRWRFVIAPRWLAWHLVMVVSVFGMLALGDWQLRRAESGNALSWAYTFEWPFFAILAVVFWAKTLKDEAHPPAADAEPAVELPATVPPGGSGSGGAAAAVGTAGNPATAEEDEELAAYNAYLARLQREVKGHGKWHGWR